MSKQQQKNSAAENKSADSKDNKEVKSNSTVANTSPPHKSVDAATATKTTAEVNKKDTAKTDGDKTTSLTVSDKTPEIKQQNIEKTVQQDMSKAAQQASPQPAKATSQGQSDMTNTNDKNKAATNDGNKIAAAKETAKAEINKSGAKSSTQTTLDAAKSGATPPPPPPKKEQPSGGKGLSGIALLVAVGALGLSGYNYYQTMGASQNTAIDTLKSEMEGQIKTLSSNTDTLQSVQTKLASDLTAATEKVDQFVTGNKGYDERFTALEQTQKGLVDSVSKAGSGNNEQLENSLKSVQASIQQLQQNQQSLNAQLTAQTGTPAVEVDTTRFVYQEVAYLLRLAGHELTIGQNVDTALSLLTQAKNSLMLVENKVDTSLISAIDEKIIRLQGVSKVDKEALINQVQSANNELDKLIAKAAKSEPLVEEKEDTGVFAKVLNSAIKYTPNTAESVTVGPEAEALAKRFIQLDVKTAIYAIQQDDKLLLTQSINSIKQILQTAFEQDANYNAVVNALDAVADSELTMKLPDLSGLVNQANSLANTTN